MTQKTKQYELFLLGRKALKFCEKHLFYRSPCTYCFRIPCFLLSSFKFSSSVIIHLAVVVFDHQGWFKDRSNVLYVHCTANLQCT